MMKYQQVSYNFVPKAEDLKNNSTLASVKDDNAQLLHNSKLLNELEELKEKLDFAKQQLELKESELFSATTRLDELEYQIQKYNEFKNDIDHIDSLNIKIENLVKERDSLSIEIKQQQEHIHTLYMIMLVLAFI
ncbi:hypothetical protein F8154_03165 [Alkaliphilus pronyensis]|uniref:Uncharacterized protein n=1 Tax=Alkaliphilus pronyensis TaxID=1482732 RepID=A0A6I0FDJ2_9FIRM|nr:hypothetical protein [Alkaliphilus pronyensis]KAB3537307.1 hypothetical protein F8154_03165 [Alkaliphilus pronyensis]